MRVGIRRVQSEKEAICVCTAVVLLLNLVTTTKQKQQKKSDKSEKKTRSTAHPTTIFTELPLKNLQGKSSTQ